ncbi:MAG: 50S ribosomal protein L5 [Chlamydiae bacterium CG10_big_fil_rev_8_21_14_0_10_35_9]|nr:MAG: 50S ribosomal protein L5 [Chlamydiae bacterium CG10_big_fil_rev_8_21_14_0_10_35_9]
MSRLQKKFNDEILPKLKEKYKDKNPMQLPRLKKIIISMGIAEAAKDKNAMQDHINELTLLSAQKPIITRAKKAISNFKLREESPVGLMVTLRGKRMFEFLDRFCNIACPRIRDFRGFSTKCDGRGNYSVGLNDQQIFPEIDLDKVKRSQGMNITFVTTADKDEECVDLLTNLGFPFK